MSDDNERLALLRGYLGRLAADMGSRGKFAAAGEDPVDAALRAVLNGGSAMARQLGADLKAIGGAAAAMAAPIAEGFVANAAAEAAKAAVGRAAAALGDLFKPAPPPPAGDAAKRRAGKAFMDAAAKMKR